MGDRRCGRIENKGKKDGKGEESYVGSGGKARKGAGWCRRMGRGRGREGDFIKGCGKETGRQRKGEDEKA